MRWRPPTPLGKLTALPQTFYLDFRGRCAAGNEEGEGMGYRRKGIRREESGRWGRNG